VKVARLFKPFAATHRVSAGTGRIRTDRLGLPDKYRTPASLFVSGT
jgi:hypothetical protein